MSAPGDAPSFPAALIRVVLGLALLIISSMAVGVLFFFLSGRVTGVARVLVAIAMSLFILWFGIGYFRHLANPPPPDPEPMDVHPGLRLAYLCEMCGLELAVVKVAKERAPKHCGESMQLIRGDH
ncbi:MAG TPA: hypothetical protein VND22_00180 [Actinomycetota bacterium]|nr:hypothetical protein [Actinomycetota bacterium]